MCGAATDLALNSLVNLIHKEVAQKDTGSERNAHEKPLLAIMIALCCHHRCDWGSFVGKKYITEQAGFSPQEFTLLCGITSWATCGSGKPRNTGKKWSIQIWDEGKGDIISHNV